MPKRATRLDPPSLPRPVGYAHAWAVSGGTTVHIAGQVAVDADGHVVGAGDLVAQFRQVCENLRAAVAAAGGTLADVVKLTIYVLDRGAYKARLAELGAVYREYFGRHYPAMTLVEVRGLFDDDRGVLLEVEATAVVAGEVPPA
jgi:enamine deaminase RidA (YjgF/YER057c/UK114 family)